ncbi:serine hydrolase [Planctomycetaceae bacterium SH139]
MARILPSFIHHALHHVRPLPLFGLPLSLLFGLLVLPATDCRADDPPAPADAVPPQERIEKLLNTLIIEDAPGIAVRVQRGDQVLLDQAYGLADLAHHNPVTPETKFRIGSVTKHITAAAILKLAEQDQLQLDDTLDKYLPDFPRGEEVTITQLLNHTSGIASYTSQPEFMDTVLLATDEQEMIKSIASKPYDFDPGTKWSYNNSGYFILGHLIGKLSGKSYAEYLQAEFFTPLEMHDTGVHTPQPILRHEATGYSLTSSGFEKALNWDMSRAGGAGAIYSTTGDLARWTQAYFSGQVISPESIKLATAPLTIETTEEPIETQYGLGWFVDQNRGLDRISHGGGLQGFSSHLAYYPGEKIIIVVLHNALPAVPAVSPSQISDRIAEAFLSNKMTDPADRQVDTSVTAEAMQKLTGKYDYQTAVMEITFDDGQLYAQLTGQPKYQIYPASPTTYFWKVVDAEVEFKFDEDGQVIAAKHRQGLSNFTAPKIPERREVELAKEVLQRHVGIYRVTALGKIEVTLNGSQLMAKVEGQFPIAIFPTSENEFFYKIVPATIQFSDLQNDQSQAIKLEQAGQTFQGTRTPGEDP